MIKHYVTFLFPGIFMSEESTKEILSYGWTVENALNIAKEYKSQPFAFYFTTFERKEEEWEPKEVARSGIYYIGGEVKNLQQVIDEKNPCNEILISNMKCNRWGKVIKTVYGNYQPFFEGDVCLQEYDLLISLIN